MNEQRVVLAMSGGVDSSVAAHLLLEQGYEVIGVFMRHGEETTNCDPESGDLPIVDVRQSSKQGCCTSQDAFDARRVADRFGIPFYSLNLQTDFRRIIDYFVDEYGTGRTPNPCVMCNNWIKFGKLFDYADSVDAKFVATGHYAQLTTADDNPQLRRGIDGLKDQSYVLFGVDAWRLPRMMLPIGEYRKQEIRRIAIDLDLRVANKRDSQEICFVEAGQHAQFVRNHRGSDQSGEIVTTDGRIVGRHPGIEGFTIGQRKGLGVAMGEPYFVVEIDASTHRVIIGRRDELERSELTANQTNWLVDIPVGQRRPCAAQIRYNSPAWPAHATRLPEGHLHVEFDQPCRGIAPGQAVVCYDADQILGGGWII